MSKKLKGIGLIVGMLILVILIYMNFMNKMSENVEESTIGQGTYVYNNQYLSIDLENDKYYYSYPISKGNITKIDEHTILLEEGYLDNHKVVFVLKNAYVNIENSKSDVYEYYDKEIIIRE